LRFEELNAGDVVSPEEVRPQLGNLLSQAIASNLICEIKSSWSKRMISFLQALHEHQIDSLCHS
jgi:hypothetical protein